MPTTQLQLLKTRRFLPLFITQFLGAFNDNAFKNALVILITFRLAESVGFSPQILVTLAAGIFILPFFLFSALAGQLADKYEKSFLIKIIKSVEIFLMVIAAAGFYWQNVPLLIFVLFALGTHSTFFGPLKYAILPDHLQENELIAGNGLIEAGTFIAILLGTIIGGVFILSTYGEYTISALIISLAICGWLSSQFIPKTQRYNPSLPISYHIFKETFQLIGYARARQDIYACVLGISWFWLVGATFLAELPVFAKNILHANDHVVTFFLTLFSIGLALGSLLCNKLLKGKVHAAYVPFGALGITLFTLDLYFTAGQTVTVANNSMLIPLLTFLTTWQGWHITVDLLLIAACGGIYTVPLYAILQQRSEKDHRARVIASNNIMNALFMVGAAIATVCMLKAGLTVNHVFLVTAIANGFVAVYLYKLV
ncbi:MAG TPA: MFS transporter [Gammaproteobacteria bacterium]|jgi:acyl-[acyl-carrier-protein]-phospholipid O-acyltransferase/long-chain-fatty-acid--[acyl-carrier-protein] ligase|nr:MFS transporter [Gammaproteobacteria bacterium]